MSSFASSQRHLDATAGREVVYCHACQNEWYRDGQEGIECPRCHSEATEIISPDNDPRDIHDHPPIPDFGGTGPHFFPRGHDTDSDPEEADIEEHVTHAPNGVFMRRRVFRSSPGPQNGTPRPDRGERVDPADGDAILQRFTDMLMNDFRVGAAGRSGPDALFPGQNQQQQHQHPEAPPNFFLGAPPRFQRTTIIGSGPHGGRTTFTISTGGFQTNRSGNPAEIPDFNAVFGNLMNNVPPPNPADPNDPNRAGGPGGGPQQRGNVFAASLHDILAALLNPAAAGAHGDAVYSQEALDRIITTLMESNPQSNAAPPASSAAIDSLERKKIDEEMLGPEGKAECTICIDSMHKGDEVLVLPCKHWFHGECVIMWLKEHNTCPICRTPIEGPNNNNSSSSGPQQPGQPQTTSEPSAGMFTSSSPAADRFRSERSFRSPRENEERLNAIRNLGGYGSSSNRRSSMSPPAPSTSDHSSRTRVRSPSSSRDRDPMIRPTREWTRYGAETDGQSRDGNNPRDDAGGNQGHSGYGPFGWLRDQFSRNSGGGSNNNRRQQ